MHQSAAADYCLAIFSTVITSRQGDAAGMPRVRDCRADLLSLAPRRQPAREVAFCTFGSTAQDAWRGSADARAFAGIAAAINTIAIPD